MKEIKKYKLIEYDIKDSTTKVKNEPSGIIHLVIYLNKKRVMSRNEIIKIESILSTKKRFLIRFAYIKDENVFLEPSLYLTYLNCSMILPVLNRYNNIIALQIGFIGKWGEGFYTKHNKKKALKLITYFLHSRYKGNIQLRTIKQKTFLFGKKPVPRVGFFNDAFLNKYGHGGTFSVDFENGNISQEDLVQYFQQVSVGGIMSAETNGLNPPHTDWINAKKALEFFNIKYINGYYHPDVLENWQLP